MAGRRQGHAETCAFRPADLDSLWSDIPGRRDPQRQRRLPDQRADAGARQFGRPQRVPRDSLAADGTFAGQRAGGPERGVGRNADDNAQRFTITNMEKSMDTTTETPVQTPAAPAASVASAEEVREAATRAERERISMIRAAVNGLDIPAETVDQWIADGKNVAECRAEIIESLKRKETPMNPRISVGEDLTRAAVFAGVESAMLSRMTGGKVEDVARPFAYASFLDMARAVLAQTGRNTAGMPRHEIATQFMRAHSTSDFPYILANVANKRMQRQYAENVPSYARWARALQRAGLQDHQRHAARQQPGAVAQGRGRRITYGTVSEKREQYTIATYARGLAVTRDDRERRYARVRPRHHWLCRIRARRLENSLVYQQLTANGNMSDGVALFHSTHGNLSTGATTGARRHERSRRARRRPQAAPQANRHGVGDPEPDAALHHRAGGSGADRVPVHQRELHAEHPGQRERVPRGRRDRCRTHRGSPA